MYNVNVNCSDRSTNWKQHSLRTVHFPGDHSCSCSVKRLLLCLREKLTQVMQHLQLSSVIQNRLQCSDKSLHIPKKIDVTRCVMACVMLLLLTVFTCPMYM